MNKISNKGVFPISKIATKKIRTIHLSDESIARCNKNSKAQLLANKKELQRSLEGANEEKIGMRLVLKMR